LEAVSHFWSLTGDVEGRFQLSSKQALTIGFTQILTRAFAEEYNSPPTESQSSIFASFKQKIENTDLQLTVRQSLVDGELLGFSPSISFNSPLNEHLSVGGKVSRNYRLPTLNDRFWRPGGNPDLRAENGWSQELSLQAETGGFRYGVTVFNRNIHDWILWSPADDENFWSAKNLTKVWSRGIEQRLSHQVSMGKWAGQLSGGYDFILSTNEVTLETPRIGAGEQLIYIPKHQAFAGIRMQFQSWSFSYRHRMVSNFSGPNERLGGHHLGYFRTAYDFQKKEFSGNFYFRLDNVWNANYRVVERRPMPGRHFLFGMKINFKKQKI
jgi:iron complex outermembrane receptor protein